MNMGIEESGQDHTASEIDRAGGCVTVTQFVAANGEYPPASDRNRLAD
jgi:hypothetical protein